ncbi:MAG: collagen-like triple helix repeat-containing protein [Bacilli bacterium]
MSKTLSLFFSSVAMVTGVSALTLSLILPGPSGQNGTQGESGLPGSQGASGETGPSGSDGNSPYIGFNGNWWIGDEDTGVSASTASEAQEFFPSVNFELSNRETELLNATLEVDLSSLEKQQAYAQNLISNQGYIGISTPAELMGISNPSGKYVLLNTINFMNVVAPAWSPINIYDGIIRYPFSGVLDGAGFQIRSIYYSTINEYEPFLYYGLFDELVGAEIRNLEIVDFSFYTMNFDRMGLIAGVASNSVFENIRFTGNRINSSGDYVGAIAGSLVDSQVSFVSIDDLEISGNYNLGGIAGYTYLSEFSHIQTLNVSIDGRYGLHGGIVGASERSHYLMIDSQLYISLGGNSQAVDRFNIGGVIGESRYDRLFEISTTGELLFQSLDENYYSLIKIGGVIGFAVNTLLKNISNEIDLGILINFPVDLIFIQSIGGVVGATEFVAIENAYNYGDVVLDYNREILDEGRFIFGNDHPIEYLGGIIGYIYASAFIHQVVNFGAIEGMVDVGGIIGSTGIPLFFFQQFIFMNEIANFGFIRGILNVGGVMGLNDQRTNLISLNLMNFGQILSEYYAGGLFGKLSPTLGIHITIKNAYNVGEVIVEYYNVGGLIGATEPVDFNFEFPNLGEVSIYHAFNFGYVASLQLGFDDNNFQDRSAGGIIGDRQILTYMYQVYYVLQITEAEIFTYDWTINGYVGTGRFENYILDSVGSGNAIDMIRVEDPYAFIDPNNFVFNQIWDFDNIWIYVEYGPIMIPILSFLNFLN